MPNLFTVNFSYAIGQEILVKPLGLPGLISGLAYDREGYKYQVVYWSDGKRNEEFLFEQEIGPAKKGEGQ